MEGSNTAGLQYVQFSLSLLESYREDTSRPLSSGMEISPWEAITWSLSAVSISPMVTMLGLMDTLSAGSFTAT